MAETREITLLIDSDIDDELTAIAQATGRDKHGIARESLVEWRENLEDIRDVSAMIAQGNPEVSLEEVERILGLDR